MKLTFLGKSTQGGGSPSLYVTDRGTYVVQGWMVAGESPTVVEIPESLLRYLQADTELGVPLRSIGRQWTGDGGDWATYTLTGAAVTDPGAHARMNLTGHETCVEVGRVPKQLGRVRKESSAAASGL